MRMQCLSPASSATWLTRSKWYTRKLICCSQETQAGGMLSFMMRTGRPSLSGRSSHHMRPVLAQLAMSAKVMSSGRAVSRQSMVAERALAALQESHCRERRNRSMHALQVKGHRVATFRVGKHLTFAVEWVFQAFFELVFPLIQGAPVLMCLTG